jgi:cell division septal protein FtsQ
MKKKFVLAFVLLALFSSYKPQKLFFTTKFNIEKIIIENNFILKTSDIKKKLFFLYDTNLIFLNSSNVKKKLKKIDFIESFEVKKIYPDHLKIKIYEKKPIAILLNKKEKFYISENISLINYINLKNYKNLPLVFGDKENFKELYNSLKKINFPLDTIQKYYLYETKRWDLEIHEKRIIKLPVKNYVKSLENFMNIKKKNNFDQYKVFDYRINNQLILK